MLQSGLRTAKIDIFPLECFVYLASLAEVSSPPLLNFVSNGRGGGGLQNSSLRNLLWHDRDQGASCIDYQNKI